MSYNMLQYMALSAFSVDGTGDADDDDDGHDHVHDHADHDEGLCSYSCDTCGNYHTTTTAAAKMATTPPPHLSRLRSLLRKLWG